jgi:PadR family transcriptional regulator PadR
VILLNDKSQFLKGTLEGCILKIINDKEIYGYEIAETLKSYGLSGVSEGTIYPLLLRLEKAEYLNSTKKESPYGPKRKYYRLSLKGKEELKNFYENWIELKDSIDKIFIDYKPCSIFKDENSVLYNFNSSVNGWTGSNLADGPALTNEWNHNGSGSLKADINLANGANYYLSNPANISLSGESQIQAVVRNVPGAKQGSSMGAKLYIKTGNSTKCYYGDEVKVNSSKCGTVLNLNLTSVPNINNVTEIGVQFTAGANVSGTSTIYLANVTAN